MTCTLVEDKTKEAGAYKIRFSISFSSFIPKEKTLVLLLHLLIGDGDTTSKVDKYSAMP